MILLASDQPRLRSFDKSALLRAHPFFKDLERGIVEQLALRAVTRKVKKGTVIFRKSDTGSSLFAVGAGTIAINSESDGGKTTTFNLITPGQVFGEIACLDGGERTATAVAIEDSQLIVVERRDLMHVLRERPELAIKLIEVICGRLRKTSEQVLDIASLGLPQRLAKVLLHLYRQASNEPRADKKIRITQREISQMIGASRESANKELRAWQRRKWLKIERGGVIVLAPEALAQVVSQGGVPMPARERAYVA